jgi:hypothetical protein
MVKGVSRCRETKPDEVRRIRGGIGFRGAAHICGDPGVGPIRLADSAA